MSNFHNYPTNGRSGESTLIKSTKIKSGNKEYLATNGKTFNKVYKKKLLSSNSVLNVNKTEKKRFYFLDS